MLPRAALAVVACLLTADAPIWAAQYKVVIRRLDRNIFQAQASKVIIETRLCEAMSTEDLEEAILNWEGSFGNNWILFTGSRTKCDVASIR